MVENANERSPDLTLPPPLSKGQLISKCLFGIFNSPPKKTNEKIRLYYYGNSNRIVFVRFLGELKTPKRHFENNWTGRKTWIKLGDQREIIYINIQTKGLNC